MPERAPEWVGTAEAARELGLTLRTLYRLIDEGALPAYRFGRVIRLKAADVAAFVEASRVRLGELAHLYPTPSGPGREEDRGTTPHP